MKHHQQYVSKAMQHAYNYVQQFSSTSISSSHNIGSIVSHLCFWLTAQCCCGNGDGSGGVSGT
eukprot:15342323-Ditylum_brightwellii.AAC.1